jgi:arginine decarboxylase
MTTIRVAWGTATGPTALSAYDAALADANLHNYNLVRVSSVVPADAEVRAVGTAPDLGPVGSRLTVVEAAATAPGPCSVAAALGWATSDDGGVFYESSGESANEVEATVREGLAAGRDLRDWSFGENSVEVVSTDGDAGTYAAAVVVAAYGRGEQVG